MNRFWRIVMFGEVSFAWTLLFVICIACILYLGLCVDASMNVIFPIFTLGFLAAVAERVMRGRNSP